MIELCAASEISPADMIYKPQAALGLETISSLPSRSRDLRKLSSQMHPCLTQARRTSWRRYAAPPWSPNPRGWRILGILS
jgi:hypothetical protein